MARVFLSYDRDDEAKAKSIALALEKAGHSVWWDRHIKGGAQYSKEIEAALKAAEAVVVLWSAHSVESPWVRDEAAAGRDSGRLVPATLDGTDPPLGFRQYQTIDLSRWSGRGKSAASNQLLGSVNNLGKADAAAMPTVVLSPKASPRPSVRRMLIPLVVVALLLAGGVAAWNMVGRGNGVPTIAVAAADASPSTKTFARDLLVKLGTLHSAKSGSMQLVSGDGNGRKPADMVFQIAGEMRAQKPAASLVLMTGKDGEILWSGDFEQDSGNLADLEQQVAFTAARVLGCALEGLSTRKARLSQSVLKLYLNACALLGNTFMADSGDAIPILEKVTQQAPRFGPGWAKLLLAATDRY